ncbi:hypothetical protein AB1Y20_001012 [Prymnesium parvum]|uniref:SNF2 N-terminal domain-containing protein n=1 Tax=Prymnesium parvum TaxID=97485 RepID=A0AB34K7J1_PRYPA
MDESHQNDSRGASQWCSQATQRGTPEDRVLLMLQSAEGAHVGCTYPQDLARALGRQLVGDEPGLGKTFQVVVLVDALISASLVQRALIVAPAEMETMWAAQFNNFLPRAALELTGFLGTYLEIVISKAL